MGHLKIYCDSCGSTWNVYSRDDWKDRRFRQCPVCGVCIERQTWERQILRAFGEMEDSTRELLKDHTGSHMPLFTVSYIPDVIFPNREPHGISAIREYIEELKEQSDITQLIIDKLLEGRNEE